jgi:propanol-preferring alcohol dehydrogenase
MTVPEIPAKQKAVIYDQPGKVSTKVVEIDVPEPSAGEVLINLYVHADFSTSIGNSTDNDRTHSGVCHSDLGIMTNTVRTPTVSQFPHLKHKLIPPQWSMLPYPTQPGQVGGHEGVGKVVKLGAGTEASNLKIGDRVGIKWVSSACGHCRT